MKSQLNIKRIMRIRFKKTRLLVLMKLQAWLYRMSVGLRQPVECVLLRRPYTSEYTALPSLSSHVM